MHKGAKAAGVGIGKATYGGCPGLEDGMPEVPQDKSSVSTADTSTCSKSDGVAEAGGTISQMDAYFALVKGNLGPGVLALPYAFSQTGWADGLPVLLLVVGQGVYAMLVLAECKQAVARSGITDLGDMAHAALGPCGRFAADLFVFIVQSGVCCCFVNLVGGNLTQALGIAGRREMTLVLAPFFALLALLRFVAQLGWLNKLGSVAMAVAVVTGTVCGIHRMWEVGFDAFVLRAGPYRSFSDPIMLASSVFFAFEGLGIVLPIEKEMKEPWTFPNVAVAASATLAVSFLLVSFTCGIAYRGELQSGSIVAFLASRPGHGIGHFIVQLADYLVTLAVFLTYPLQLLPASEILGKWLGIEDSTGEPGSPGANRCRCMVPGWVVVRLALVAASVALALSVDNVTLLVSLFGAVGQTGLGIVAPLCHLAFMRSGRLEAAGWRVVMDVAIVFFCVLIMIFGTYFAVLDITEAW